MAKYYTENNQLVIQKDCNHIMLVYTDANNNNNKFYEIELSGNNLLIKYGRVDKTPQSLTKVGGFSEMCSLAHSKYKKGYKPVDTIDVDSTVTNPLNLSNIAVEQLTFKPRKTTKSYTQNDINIVESLVKHLVENNQHEILSRSGNRIQVDDSGLVKTSLGVLSLNTLNQASDVLSELQKEWEILQKQDNPQFTIKLNQYLTMIPQAVPAKRGWDKTFFKSKKDFDKQYDFIEQLKESVKLYESLVANQSKSQNIDIPEVFSIKLKLVTDKKVLSDIENYYENSKNDSHVSKTLKLKNVYELVLVDDKGKAIPNISPEFEQKEQEIGNKQFYWHGSRKFNILSILKSGLIIPKSNNFNVTGRMFGDGVYFANQSTKALNYSFGYWDSKGHDSHCFMFLADVLMGKPFKAAEYKKHHQDYGVYPVEGYDSTIATGNKVNLTHNGSTGRLANNEFIVYNLNQINLRYLCEFN